MTIETKYNIGDEVWTINSMREPIIVKVLRITIISKANSTHIDYNVFDGECSMYREEIILFPTKEELLKSL